MPSPANRQPRHQIRIISILSTGWKGTTWWARKNVKVLGVALVPALVGTGGAVLGARLASDARIDAAVRARDETIAAQLAKDPHVTRLILDSVVASPAKERTSRLYYVFPESFLQALRKERGDRPLTRLPKNPSIREIERHSDIGWQLYVAGSVYEGIQIQEACLKALDKPGDPTTPRAAANVKARLGQMLGHNTERADSALAYLRDACVFYSNGVPCTVAQMKTSSTDPTLQEEHLYALTEILNDVGLLYRRLWELDLAQGYYEASEAFLRRLPTDSVASEQHAWNQNGLGLISLRRYYKTRNPADLRSARTRFLEAEAFFRAHTGSHPLGSVINHLALVDYLEDKYQNARTRLAKVERIWKDQLGSLSPDVELTYENLSRIHTAMAEKHQDRAAVVSSRENASHWKHEAAAVRDKRELGIDVRLRRDEALYSVAGRDEWLEAMDRLRPTKKP